MVISFSEPASSCVWPTCPSTHDSAWERHRRSVEYRSRVRIRRVQSPCFLPCRCGPLISPTKSVITTLADHRFRTRTGVHARGPRTSPRQQRADGRATPHRCCHTPQEVKKLRQRSLILLGHPDPRLRSRRIARPHNTPPASSHCLPVPPGSLTPSWGAPHRLGTVIHGRQWPRSGEPATPAAPGKPVTAPAASHCLAEPARRACPRGVRAGFLKSRKNPDTHTQRTRPCRRRR